MREAWIGLAWAAALLVPACAVPKNPHGEMRPRVELHPHYEMTVRVDANAREIVAEARVSALPQSFLDAPEIWLREDMEIDGSSLARLPGETLAWTPVGNVPSGVRGNSRILRLQPPRDLRADDVLIVRYHGGKATALSYYIGPDAAFMVGIGTSWYPQIGELRATGTLTYEVPPGFSLMGSGTTTIRSPRETIVTTSWPSYFSRCSAVRRDGQACRKRPRADRVLCVGEAAGHRRGARVAFARARGAGERLRPVSVPTIRGGGDPTGRRHGRRVFRRFVRKLHHRAVGSVGYSWLRSSGARPRARPFLVAESRQPRRLGRRVHHW